MKLLFYQFILLITTVTLLSGCVGNGISDDHRVFRYNESAGIATLDPAHARSLEMMWAVDAIYDGLVELSPDLEVIPAIAESWDWVEGGVVFHLRKGVMFSAASDVPGLENGRELVASDVVYSLERLRDPVVASPGGWILDAVMEDGIIALDDRTVKISLKNDFPPFLGLLTTPYASIVAPEAVEARGVKFRFNPAGTGPFKVAWSVEDVALVLHKNTDYWEKDEAGHSLPYLDAVHIDFVPDMGSEYLGLIQGRYDFMSGLHPAYMEDLMTQEGTLAQKHQENLELKRVAFLKTDYVGILIDSISDPRVRKALSLSIDRAGIAKNLRRGSVLPSDRFIPPSMLGNRLHSSPEYNLELASELLVLAGYPGGVGLPVIELATTSDYVDICAAIQHGWQKIGIKVEVDVSPATVHREKVATSKSVMFKKSWLADHADAENFLGLFLERNFSPGGPNYTHFKSPHFEELYDRAMLDSDESSRVILYEKMDSILYAEMPVLPLYHDQVTHFVRKSVKGWVVSPVNRLELRYVSKTEKH